MFRVVFGSDFWLRLVLEVEFHRLDLLVAAAGLVSRVVQRAHLGLGVPLELHLGDLRFKFDDLIVVRRAHSFPPPTRLVPRLIYAKFTSEKNKKTQKIVEKRARMRDDSVSLIRTINSIPGSKRLNLFVTTAGRVFLVLRGDLRLRFAEVQLPVLYLHLAAAWLVARVVQGADLRSHGFQVRRGRRADLNFIHRQLCVSRRLRDRDLGRTLHDRCNATVTRNFFPAIALIIVPQEEFSFFIVIKRASFYDALYEIESENRRL